MFGAVCQRKLARADRCRITVARLFRLHCGSKITDRTVHLALRSTAKELGGVMKKLFLGSVALVALGLGTQAAFAAEMRVPAYTPPPPPAPVYTWSGCYAGGVAGTSWGRSNRTAVLNTAVPQGAGLPITNDFDLSGFTGGFDVGCNWQVGVWIFGVEGDWLATNKAGQAFGIAPFNTLHIHETQERWVATARGRIGWTWWDKTLVYVTGGGAWTKVD